MSKATIFALALLAVQFAAPVSAGELASTGDDTFKKDVLTSKQTVIVDFYATWCGPCKMLAPRMEALSQRQDLSKIKFYRLDVEANPKTANKYGVKFLPTVVVFKQGKIVDKAEGNPSPDDLSLLVKHATDK